MKRSYHLYLDFDGAPFNSYNTFEQAVAALKSECRIGNAFGGHIEYMGLIVFGPVKYNEN